MTRKLKLKPTHATLVVSVMASVLSFGALAVDYNSAYNGSHYDSTIDYAKVVDVDPIVETYRLNKPVEQCWNEKVPVRSRYSGHGKHRSYTGEILGGIIGGAIGNQFGSGRGKKVATAAGAILGASVANDVKHKQRNYDTGRYEIVERCELTDNYTIEEQIVGYKVAYKYQGRVFHTEMDRDPGDRIKVRVSVDPV